MLATTANDPAAAGLERRHGDPTHDPDTDARHPSRVLTRTRPDDDRTCRQVHLPGRRPLHRRWRHVVAPRPARPGVLDPRGCRRRAPASTGPFGAVPTARRPRRQCRRHRGRLGRRRRRRDGLRRRRRRAVRIADPGTHGSRSPRSPATAACDGEASDCVYHLNDSDIGDRTAISRISGDVVDADVDPDAGASAGGDATDAGRASAHRDRRATARHLLGRPHGGSPARVLGRRPATTRSIVQPGRHVRHRQRPLRRRLGPVPSRSSTPHR